MPLFNQWKIKSNFFFRQLSAAELQPMIDFLLTRAPADDITQAVAFLQLTLWGGQVNRIDPNSAVMPAREGTVSLLHGGGRVERASTDGAVAGVRRCPVRRPRPPLAT
jgi:hypothetical protein